MNDPQNMVQYLLRYKQHEHTIGAGLSAVQHTPCPFCAASDFWVYPIVDIRAAVQRETTCVQCGRTALTILVAVDAHLTKFEVIQTAGPSQPAWLQPKLRQLTYPQGSHDAC